MLRNYLSAALGNLARNWIHAAITMFGLAVAFAAAILIGLYVRDEFSFERFIPGHERIYRLDADVTLPGAKPQPMVFTSGRAAGYLKLDFPEIETAARLSVTRSQIKIGDVAGPAPVVWADPDFFKVMAYPVLAGDPVAALEAPDGVVLTHEAARRYFGVDAPIGRVLLVNPALDFVRGVPEDELRALTSFHPMRVMAVLKDVPSNTHLTAQIYAAARAAFSATALDERHGTPLGTNVLTYVKLKPGASARALQAQLVEFADRRFPEPGGARSRFRYRLLPLAAVHFSDAGMGPSGILRPSADRKVVAGIGGVGILVVLIAAMNFVALTNARGARRAVEVGVRKVAGAQRRDLVVQFLGEALLQVTIAMAIAMALADLAIGPLDAFLHKPMPFNYLGDPGLAVALAGGVLLTALLAGLYPALAISAFRPNSALKGGAASPRGAAPVQRALVVGQFAILIGLIVTTGTIYRQTEFALKDALRMDVSQVIWMQAPCRSSFQREVAALPGVKAAACASRNAYEMGMTPTSVIMPDRSIRTANQSAVDTGFFELQGIKPLAGRLFSESHVEDLVLQNAGTESDLQPTIVLNEAAARVLGFKKPADAVGARVNWERLTGGLAGRHPPARTSSVVGVVPDFTFASIRNRTPPSIYYVDPAGSSLMVFKLDGRAIPETLAAIKRLWTATGHDGRPGYVFESEDIQDLYGDVVVQGVVVGICSGLAISIACLGLFSLAAFTTERRTKEIGVRKALGARTGDIVWLLLWQFTRPVLWANLIAWPVAFWAMNRWLDGFVYRVELPPWLFLAASVVALLIAWTTVSVHTFIVARAKPVAALRYE